MSFDLTKEMREIASLINEADLIMAVRKEVEAVNKGAIVTDGNHQDNVDYQVIVRCGEEDEKVARRLRSSMPDIDVEKLAVGILGVNQSRRG
jgi:hypothetical protein